MPLDVPIHVLHVDDDANGRQSLGWFLQAEGFVVTEAATGTKALELARTHPDIIILDVKLPDVSGLEVCRRLKADPATASIPVLQVSGYFTDSEDRARALDGGADAYLVKPADPRELVAYVRALVRVRRAEQKLRAQADILAQVHDAIISTDLEGRVTGWNGGAERIYGYRAYEILGNHVAELCVPEDRPTLPGQVIALVQARGAHEMEVRVRRKSGEVIDVHLSLALLRDARGQPHGVVGCSQDITERRRAEEAAHRLASIVESADEAIIGKTLDGTITSWNAGATRMYGYEAAEALGRPIGMLAPPERADEVLGILGRICQGKRVEQFETVRVRKDGTPLHVSLTVSPIKDAAGAVVGVSTVARDVTHRKALEEQLRQAQKMEGIGQLAGGIAHDFNNLLTVINGYTDLLLGRTRADDPARDFLQAVRQAGERAASLTRQLLAFSRKQILAPAVLELNRLVAELEKILRRLIGEDIELTTVLDPALGRIKADPGQVEQVLLNLIVNARDAMPSGGSLSLETRNTELDAAYAQAHPGVQAGSYVVVSVRDTGCGMTPEVKARIFEPFFTTKEVGKGTGLGLATVYGIIRQSGGHVEVESEPGRGTTFRIYFPRIEEPPGGKRTDSASLAIPQGAETILLAEDEEGVRQLARLMLESAGYQVLEARNGAEALTVAAGHAGPLHLLVTDVVMPRLGGRGLAERLASARPDVKVLYLSGYTDEAIFRHGVLEPGTALLQKPFTAAALARKVREVLDRPEK